MVSWRCASASCCEGRFLLFLVIFLSDDFDARRKGSESIYVVAVAVREDHRGYRLGGNLADVLKQLAATSLGCLCVDDNYAVLTDDDRAIAAATLDPVDV